MTPVSTDDYKVSPAGPVTFDDTNTGTTVLEAKTTTVWYQVTVNVPEKITKVTITVGDKVIDAEIKDGKATWLSGPDGESGKTLKITITRSPDGPENVSLDTLKIIACKEEVACKDKMTPVSTDDYKVSPAGPVTFDDTNTGTTVLEAKTTTVWYQVTVNVPEKITKVTITVGDKVFDAEIKDGKATWLSGPDGESGKTLKITITRSPDGPENVSLDTLKIIACKEEVVGSTTTPVVVTTTTPFVATSTTVGVGSTTTPFVGTSTTVGVGSTTTPFVGTATTPVACKDKMTPVSTDDYKVSPAGPVTFDDTNTGTTVLEAKTTTVWYQVTVNVPEKITKVTITVGDKVIDAEIKDGKATWLSGPDGESGKTLKITITRSPDGPENVSLDTLKIIACKEEVVGSTTTPVVVTTTTPSVGSTTTPFVGTSTTVGVGSTTTPFVGTSTTVGVGSTTTPFVGTATTPVACKDKMTPVSTDDYKVSPAGPVTFDDTNTGTTVLEAKTTTVWYQVTVNVPEKITKVTITVGDKVIDAEIKDGKATWLSGPDGESGKTLKITITRSPDGPENVSLDTLKIIACKEE
ncbi:mucin-5AC-like, partial [Gigantopelta aegis]|uniref:mucin-5AC-like n=1 Tax=Gigantopelta aegis TaxID=1735272 RepID=UPI001B88B856